jgi:hypothetical protein
MQNLRGVYKHGYVENAVPLAVQSRPISTKLTDQPPNERTGSRLWSMLVAGACWSTTSVMYNGSRLVVESSWNVMAHGDARKGKWRGNWRMEWVASTLHTSSEHCLSSITTTTTVDAHTSAASSRLNWRLRRFKWTRPFRPKTKSGFWACAITFQTQSTENTLRPGVRLIGYVSRSADDSKTRKRSQNKLILCCYRTDALKGTELRWSTGFISLR